MKLFIVWNSYSILEFISSVDDYKEYYCLIDSFYNKNGKNNISILVEKCISLGIFKGIIEEKDVFNNYYESIAVMSYINDYNFNILKNISFKNLIFLEEGLHDYVTENVNSEYLYLLNQATFFVNNKKDILNKNLFKEVIDINYKKDILDLYMDILNVKNSLKNNVDLIVLTSPMDKDYDFKPYLKNVINYLEQNYEGKNILIKRHPRDYALYNSNKYNAIYVNSSIPGQIINIYYDCEKLYTHPSTVILSEKDVSKSKILKFKDLDNEGYLNAFEYKKMKECKIIKL